MFGSVLLVSSLVVAFFGFTSGYKVNCPVSYTESWGNGAKGKVDVDINAAENWQAWKVVLTFDKKVNVIDAFQGRSSR